MPPKPGALSAAVESTLAGDVEKVHLMWPSHASRAYRPPYPPMYTVLPSSLRTGEAAIAPTPAPIVLFQATAALVPLSLMARTEESANPRISSLAPRLSVVSAGDDVVAYWPTPNFHLM